MNNEYSVFNSSATIGASGRTGGQDYLSSTGSGRILLEKFFHWIQGGFVQSEARHSKEHNKEAFVFCQRVVKQSKELYFYFYCCN